MYILPKQCHPLLPKSFIMKPLNIDANDYNLLNIKGNPYKNSILLPLRSSMLNHNLEFLVNTTHYYKPLLSFDQLRQSLYK